MRIYFLLFLLLISIGQPLAAQPKHEIRATWLTTLGGMDWPRNKATNAEGIRKQKQELCDILDRLKEANFNTVMFQTRLRGSVVYPSAIETYAECLTGKTGKSPGYDPLAFAIEECHKRGMEIHAWIVAVPVGNARQVRLLGKHSVVQKKKSLCKLFKGSWYLDPGHPETKEYLSGIVEEIVTNYDIDGIHLDYIRYPEQGERFPDNDTYRKYGGKKDKKEWRRENITAIVRHIHEKVKRQKPWVKTSSAPVGKYASTSRYPSKGWDAYHAVHQDAQGWLEEGIHDALFPMMYFQGNDFYPFALDWKENDHGRWVVPGLGIYFLSPKEKNWPVEEICRQIHFIRENGLAGEAYFRNQFLMDNTKGILDELEYGFYTSPALVPPMTWTDSIPPTTPPSASYQLLEDGKLLLSWEKSSDNSNQPVTYQLYGSATYPVDTSLGKNLVQTSIRENQATLSEWSENLYFALTATDRYGNESAPLSINKPMEEGLSLLNEGHVLHLPDLPDAQSVSITTLAGKELVREAYERTIHTNSIAKGFYRIYIIHTSGQKSHVGYMLK